MGAIASQITSLTIVFSTIYLDTDQRKHQSSASLAFVRGTHRRPVNSPHKWPVTRKVFPFDDVIMFKFWIKWPPFNTAQCEMYFLERECLNFPTSMMISATFCRLSGNFKERKKMDMEISSAKCSAFLSGLNVITAYFRIAYEKFRHFRIAHRTIRVPCNVGWNNITMTS